MQLFEKLDRDAGKQSPTSVTSFEFSDKISEEDFSSYLMQTPVANEWLDFFQYEEKEVTPAATLVAEAEPAPTE